MNWFRNVSRERLRELVGEWINLDGVSRQFDRWEKVLEEVSRLKAGDKIFNLYTKQDDKVKSTHFEWSKIGEGEYINEFMITTETNYYLYDPPSDLETYRISAPT